MFVAVIRDEGVAVGVTRPATTQAGAAKAAWLWMAERETREPSFTVLPAGDRRVHAAHGEVAAARRAAWQ